MSEREPGTTRPTGAELDETLGKPGPPIEVDPEQLAAAVALQRAEAKSRTTDDWLPIESAPRDGSEVRVLVEVTAHWQTKYPALLLGEGWKLDLDAAQAKKWRPI